MILREHTITTGRFQGHHELHLNSKGVFVISRLPSGVVLTHGVFWRSKTYGKFGWHWPADHYVRLCADSLVVTCNGRLVNKQVFA